MVVATSLFYGLRIDRDEIFNIIRTYPVSFRYLEMKDEVIFSGKLLLVKGDHDILSKHLSTIGHLPPVDLQNYYLQMVNDFNNPAIKSPGMDWMDVVRKSGNPAFFHSENVGTQGMIEMDIISVVDKV